jgi:hypothetical protein
LSARVSGDALGACTTRTTNFANRAYRQVTCGASGSDFPSYARGTRRALVTDWTSDTGALIAGRPDRASRAHRSGRTLVAGSAGDACAWRARRSDWTYRTFRAGRAFRAARTDQAGGLRRAVGPCLAGGPCGVAPGHSIE